MKLNEAIEQALETNPAASNHDIARAALEAVPKGELLALLVDHVTHLRRHRTRDAERAAFEHLNNRANHTPISLPQPQTRTASSMLSQLAKERFSLGNGSTANWLTATREDHKQRLEFLQKQVDGKLATMERHREALRLMDATGTDTLGDALQAQNKAA